MALRAYQQEITENTLYELHKGSSGIEQIQPSIEINGGVANVYVTQIDPSAGTLPAGMNIIENGTALQGVAGFAFIPSYLYIEASADITIVLSGIDAEEVV